MASITKIVRSKYWYACYRDAAGRQHLKSTKIIHTPIGITPQERANKNSENRRFAQDSANRFEELERGNPTEAQFRKVVSDISERLNIGKMEFPSVQAYLEEWLESRRLAPTTVARYSKPIRDFIQMMGPKAKLPIASVKPADIDRFIRKRLSTGLSAVTVRTDRKILNAPFASALRAGAVLMNPVAAAEPFDAISEEKLPFTRTEVECLIETAKGTEWDTVIHLAAFAGLRLGDAVKLCWEDLDLFSNTIRFRPQKTARKKRDLVLPIAPRLKKHLLALPMQQSASGPVCPKLAITPIGGNTGLSLMFSRLMMKAGIDSERKEATGAFGRAFNRKSFHSLRHFFVSELERKGVAPDLRMKLSGHTTAMAHSRYTHTEIETLAAAVANL